MFQTLLLNNIPCSMTFKMQGQKFGLLSSAPHSAPISCLIMRNSFPSSCCLPCKMGLTTLSSAQEAEKRTSKVAEALSWKFSRRAECILSAVYACGSDISFINIVCVLSPKNCRFLSLRVSSRRSVASALLRTGCTWLLDMKMDQSVSSAS